MKKRIMSLILAIAMILTMIPSTAYAADTPYIGFRYAGWDDENKVHLLPDANNETLYTEMVREAGGAPVSFYYVDEMGEETLLKYDQIKSLDESILKISEDSEVEGVVHIDIVGIGTTEVVYNHNGTEYKMNVTANLPIVGFYTTPSATEASFVSTFDVTDDTNTMYLVAKDPYTITNVSLSEDFENVADMTPYVVGKSYEIQITGNFENGRFYEGNVGFDNGNGHSETDRWFNVRLNDARSGLKFRHPGWGENGPVEDKNNPLNTNWRSHKGYSEDAFVYFVSGGVETKLSASDLFVSNENAVKVSQHHEVTDMLVFEMLDYADDVTINYEHGGKTYSITVEGVLPDFSFYTTPEATKESYIRKDFKVTEDETTIYFVATNGFKLTRVKLRDDFDVIADVGDIDETGTYVPITITGDPDNRWYALDYDAYHTERPDDTRDNDWNEVELMNAKPGLYFRGAVFENDSMYENPDEPLQKYWITEPHYTNEVYVKYRNNGIEKNVTYEYLVSSDTSVVTVQKSGGDDNAVCLVVRGFGEATIDYKVGEETYSFDVIVGLPEVGIYSSPEPGVDTYIEEYKFTGENDKFYVATTDGWKLEEVYLEDDFANIANVVIDDSKEYATVTVTGEPQHNRYYGVHSNIAKVWDENYTERHSHGQSIKVVSGKPGLYFRWPAEGMVEDTNFETQKVWNTSVNSTGTVFAYFMNNGDETRLDYTQLTSSNPDVVTVESSNTLNAIALETQGFGEAKIQYKVGDQTYSFDVVVGLPQVGYYSSPEASPETYLEEFEWTNEGDKFYVVAIDGWKINNIELESDLDDIADYAIAENKEYATITVVGEPQNNRDYTIFSEIIREYEDGGSETRNQRRSLRFVNAKPGLKFHWGEWDGDVFYEKQNDGWFTDCERVKGENPFLFFYFVEGDTATRLSVSDLTTSNSDIVSLTQCHANGDAVEVHANDFGIAQISYVKDGVTYSVDVNVTLPELGYYSTTEASEDTYIRSFSVNEENNTFYFVGRDGWKLTNFNLEGHLAEIATCEVKEEGAYAVITVNGTPSNGQWYEVRYDAVNEDMGRSLSNHRRGLNLFDATPGLKVRWASYGPNGPEENKDEWLGEIIEIQDSGTQSVFIYYVEGDVETNVSAAEIKSRNEDIVIAYADPKNPNMLHLELQGYGSTELYYVRDGKEYTIPVICDFPAFGYYNDSYMDASTIINSYKVTDEGENVIYFIPNFGWELKSAELLDAFAECATATLDTENNYVRIEFTGEPPVDGQMYWMLFEATHEFSEGNTETVSWDWGIMIYNGMTFVPELDEEAASVTTESVNKIVEAIQNNNSSSIDSNVVSEETLGKIEEHVAAGNDIVTEVVTEVLTVDEAWDNDLEGYQEVIDELGENEYVARYLDLSVLVQAIVEEVPVELGTLNQLEDEITITITIPEGLGGIDQRFVVLRFHDGQVERLDVTDNNNGTLSFNTDKFSTYALVVEDIRCTQGDREENCPSKHFTDVPADAWYHTSVDYVVRAGIMNGTGNGTTFSPDMATTRAMIVTMLWRMAGEPDMGVTDEFTDVPADQWYAKAVAWAVEAGVSNGTGDGKFNPDGLITREQMATMLCRFAGYENYPINDTLLQSYPDGNKVSSWALGGMSWALEYGIINGKGTGANATLSPQDTASRAEAATMFERF